MMASIPFHLIDYSSLFFDCTVFFLLFSMLSSVSYSFTVVSLSSSFHIRLFSFLILRHFCHFISISICFYHSFYTDVSFSFLSSVIILWLALSLPSISPTLFCIPFFLYHIIVQILITFHHFCSSTLHCEYDHQIFEVFNSRLRQEMAHASRELHLYHVTRFALY